MKRNSKPFLSESFAQPDGGYIGGADSATNNSITIKTAVSDKNEITVIEYRDGSVKIHQESPRKKVILENEYCQKLYELIYKPFVNAKHCESDIESAADNMSDLREYHYISSLEGINRSEFEKLSASSCKVLQFIAYKEFKVKVCSGR